MIPPLNQATLVAERGGIIGHNLHRWLQLIQRALHGPFIGEMASGSFVVADGQYAVHAEELILRGTEEASLEGDSVLVVI